MKREELEKIVLSCSLQEGIGVDPDLFVLKENKEIAESIQILEERGENIEVATVAQESGVPVLELVELEDFAPTSTNRNHWVRTLRSMRRRDNLVSTVRKLAKDIETLDSDEIASRIESVLVDEADNDDEVITLRQSIQEKIKELEGEKPPSLETGLTELDKYIHPRPGQLWYVAARPGVGKSALALQIASHVARGLVARGQEVRKAYTVLGWFLEMSHLECTTRLIASESNVSVSAITGHRVQDKDWPRLAKGIGKLNGARFFYAPPRIDSIEAFVRLARRRVRTSGVKVVIVDYVGLAKSSQLRKASMNELMTRVSRDLKRLALSENVLVIALAQLNREVEKRPDSIPVLSDLRDSGSLEQDADGVLMIHYPHNYDSSEPEDRKYIYIRKNRNGYPLPDPIPVKWVGVYQQFQDWRPSAKQQRSGVYVQGSNEPKPASGLG